MKASLLVTTLALAVSWSIAGYAQTQQEHHPGGTPPPAQPPAAAAEPMQKQMPMSPMMQAMPEQCRAMMQKMPQGCMAMMQGGMGHGGATPGQMGTPEAMPGMSPSATASTATKAYVDAANKMHGPMMQGVQASDPDVAYVRGMIAHHQGAIDMAQVRLMFGKDAQTRKWADDVIREQQREIDEMELWLKKIAP